jgi:hypothetical protein
MRYTLNSADPGEEILKLTESMTAPTESLKVCPPPPNFRKVYKYFYKEISVTWRAEVFQFLHHKEIFTSTLHYMFQFKGCCRHTCLLDLSGRNN